jgi:hypothetical protein
MGRIRGGECSYLGDTILLVVVGLLEATLDGDDPFGPGILSFR